MDGVFGAIGSVAGAAISASATRDAAEKQANALKEARIYNYVNLDPNLINAKAKAADIKRATGQLALQSQIDPNLAAARNLGSAAVAQGASELGNAASDRVAAQAEESLVSDARIGELKDQLLKAALNDISSGSTLPPDLQAELVKAGLEKGGAAGVGLNSKSLAGQNTRQLIGERGLALRNERLNRATALTKFASDLEQNRTRLLTDLFPRLQQHQAGNAAMGAGAVSLSQAMMPDAGLSGENISQLWQARVLGTSNLTQQIGNTQASAAASMGNIYGKLAGGLGESAGKIYQGITNPATTNSVASADPNLAMGF